MIFNNSRCGYDIMDGQIKFTITSLYFQNHVTSCPSLQVGHKSRDYDGAHTHTSGFSDPNRIQSVDFVLTITDPIQFDRTLRNMFTWVYIVHDCFCYSTGTQPNPNSYALNLDGDRPAVCTNLLSNAEKTTLQRIAP